MTDKVEVAYAITTSEGEVVPTTGGLPVYTFDPEETVDYHYEGCSSDEVTDDEIADMLIEQLNDFFFGMFAAAASHDSIRNTGIPAIRKVLQARDSKVQAA
jgi:hypothetical protein